MATRNWFDDHGLPSKDPNGNDYPDTPGGHAGAAAGTPASGPAVAPANLIGSFPSAATVTYQPAKLAPYKFLNPIKFAKRYVKFQQTQMQKNYDFSKAIGLDELDTELKGMQGYVPAAAALQRETVAADNTFNQAQRTQQLDTAMPGARATLAAQAKRAATYASGNLPDSVQNAAFELNLRSRSADNTAAGGFGATSSVARKTSDLMSAEERFQIVQYGENLTGANIDRTAALELAPTEYSNAGSQVKVMPSVDAGSRVAQAYSETNAASLIPPSTALSSVINQRQFRTSQTQQLYEFNAANQLQADEFNAGALNQFALQKFGYQVSQAGVVAGVQTANNNTALGIQQQDQATAIYQDMMDQAQSANQVSAIIQGITSIGTAAIAATGISDAADSLGGLFKSSAGGQTGTAEQMETVAPLDINSTASTATVPRAAVFSDQASVPAEYTAMTTNPTGAVVAVPTEALNANAQVFTQDTGIRLDPTGSNEAAVTKAVLSAGAVMASAGVSYANAPGQQPIGTNLAAQPLYSSAALMTAQNARAGGAVAAGALSALTGFGVIGDAEGAALNQIGATATSDRMQSRLDTLAESQDGAGFVGATLNGLGIGAAEENKNAAYAAHQLYQVWDRLSPAQKSLALASLGVQNLKSSDKPIVSKAIPNTENTPYKPLNVGNASQLLNAGYNAYGLADAWETANDVHQLRTGRSGSSLDVADTMQSLGMLGYGSDGAAVKGISRQKLGNAGWKAVPAHGVGAITAKSGTVVPNGYVAVANNKNGVLAVPRGNLKTASVNTSLAGTAAGEGGVSLSAKTIYKSWQPKQAVKGLVGGSAAVAGLDKLTPLEQAELAAVSYGRNYA